MFNRMCLLGSSIVVGTILSVFRQKMKKQLACFFCLLFALGFILPAVGQTTHVYDFGPGEIDLTDNWSLEYGGSYWTTLFAGTIGADSLQIDNIFDQYGENYSNWGAYVWSTPYYNETIVRITYTYHRYGYIDTFEAALFASDELIESTGGNGVSTDVEWTATATYFIEGTNEETFNASENIISVGLGFVDTTSDTQNYVVFDSIEIETVRQDAPPKPEAEPLELVYNFGSGELDLTDSWSLEYGGSWWTTLFAGTITADVLRIDNVFDLYGENYPNWGAYVWNAPYSNETIVSISYDYERWGYLSTFEAALLASDQPIVSTGTNGVATDVEWTVTAPYLIQGSNEETFDLSEDIVSVGLGFVDTTSSTENLVAFDEIEIETLSQTIAETPDPLETGEYLNIQNGHFYYDGSRHRLWGINFCGYLKRALRDLPLTFERILDVGFNGVRLNLFEQTFLDGQTADTWHVPATVMGSDSRMDRLDYAMSLAKERGMLFWFSFDRHNRNLVSGDYDILPDDGHETEWCAMAAAFPLKHLVYVDERAAEVHLAYAKAIMNHVNPYTGNLYADEETIGLCEIFNENLFLSSFSPTIMFPQLPTYVQAAINAKLNTWLISRYGTHNSLKQAWKVGNSNNLYNDESLTSETILFDYGPLDAGQRLADMMEFTAQLYDDYNERFISEIRLLGTTGEGIAVIPITPTGQYDLRLLRYYGAQMSGDFVSNGSYGFACRTWETSESDPNYPFKSRLTSHPFFEHPIDLMRVDGKPYAYYEVNDYRPNPFGAEFPIRIATQMAWQDGDAVFWFNWDDSAYLPSLRSDQDYLDSYLPMPTSSYPNAGLILASDEVMLAAIKSAGTLFKNGLLPCASSPIQWTIGKDLLFDPDPASWNELEWWVRYNAWRSGVRVVFDPTVNSSSVSAGSLGSYLDQGSYVTYDWDSTNPGTLEINAPTVRAIVGATGASATVGDLSITGINGDFTSIIVVSEDGLSLSSSDSILVTLVRDSLNTGYAFNVDNLTGVGWAEDVARALSSPGGSVGTAPIIVDRVAATLSASWLAGLKYEKHNFSRQCYEAGWIDSVNPTITISASEPLFYLRLVTEE